MQTQEIPPRPPQAKPGKNEVAGGAFLCAAIFIAVAVFLEFGIVGLVLWLGFACAAIGVASLKGIL